MRSQIIDIGSYSCWRVNEEPFSNKMRLSNLEGKNFHIHGKDRGGETGVRRHS